MVGAIYALSELLLVFFFDGLKIISWHFRIPIVAEYTVPPDDASSNETSLIDALFQSHSDRPFNPSIDLPSFLYCPIVEALPLGCMTQNILELWKFDDVRIRNLTQDAIINDLNTKKISPTSGHETDFTQLLGGIERNSTGHIVSAKSILSHWMVYVNFSNVDHDKIGNAAGTEDWV